MNVGGVELVADDHVAWIKPNVTESPTLTPGEYVGWAWAGEKKCAAEMTMIRTIIALRDDFLNNLLKNCPLLHMKRSNFSSRYNHSRKVPS